MKKMMLGVVAASIIASPCIYADSENYNLHVGPYLEANVGTNLYYTAIFSSVGGINTGNMQGAGWSVGYGYHFKNSFALEAGFMQNYAEIDNDYQHINVPYVTTRFDVPVTERFSFIGKLGAMYPNIPHEGGLVLPFVGVGGSYAITRKVDFQVQYQGAVYGIAGAGLLSAGLTYHFG